MPPRPNASADQILVTTLQLIAEHDVAGVSVDMVADRAGVSKATIYRRWPSRSELIFEAMTYLPRPESNPDTGSIQGDLTVLLKNLVEFLNRPDGGRVFAAFLNAAIRDAKLAAVRSTISKNARADYERVIRRAIERGELAANVNIRLLVDVLISPFIYRRMVDHTSARASDIRPVINMALSAYLTNAPGPAADD